MIEDFEFVSVPSIKIDPSEISDDNDPFNDVQIIVSSVKEDTFVSYQAIPKRCTTITTFYGPHKPPHFKCLFV